MSTNVYTAPSANLDFLRAVAVLAVLVSHFTRSVLHLEYVGPFSMWTLGRAGVLLFFVHTALVLLMSLERSRKSGVSLAIDFYIRRAFRIYPLSIFTVLAVIAFRIPSVPDAAYQWRGWQTVFSNLLLIQNVTKTADVTAPLWSLPYEVQMYLVLPLVWLALRRRVHGLLWIAATLTDIGLWFAGAWSMAALLQYAPCFLAGTFALRRRGSLPAWLWLMWIPAMTALLSLLDPKTNILILSIESWIFCALIGVSIPAFRQITVLREPAKLIARYSYGIYLCHLPLMWLCFYVLPSSTGPLLFPALMTFMPVAFYRWIEEPMIRFGRRSSGNKPVITYATA